MREEGSEGGGGWGELVGGRRGKKTIVRSDPREAVRVGGVDEVEGTGGTVRLEGGRRLCRRS